MKKVIIFGDLPIATKVAKYITEHDGCTVSAVVIGNENPKNNDPWQDELLIDYVKSNNIKILTLDSLDISSEKYDLGISCRFSKIISKNVITKFTQGVVNFHGGLLPEFGGLFSTVHTIISGSSIGGGTLHWIDENIDTGNILKRCEVGVLNTDTGFDLFKKTQIALFDGFVEIFDSILNGTIKDIEISDLIEAGIVSNYYNRKSLDGLRYIDIDEISTTEAIRKIRAFTFLDYPSAYTKVNSGLIKLTYDKYTNSSNL